MLSLFFQSLLCVISVRTVTVCVCLCLRGAVQCFICQCRYCLFDALSVTVCIVCLMFYLSLCVLCLMLYLSLRVLSV